MPGHALAGRILIVEGDAETRELLAGFLTSHGYHVDEAADGEAGLYLVYEAETPYDLVLLDDHLPDATAREMLPALRALAAGSRVAVMSDATSCGVFYEVRARGAYEVIQKPPWLRDVLQVVARGLGERGAEALSLVGDRLPGA